MSRSWAKGDIVKVSDGYARNYILPKKLGVEATKQNLYKLQLEKEAEEKAERDTEEARNWLKGGGFFR